MKTFFATIVAVLVLGSTASANGNLLDQVRTRVGMSQSSTCEYDDLFRRGTASVPCGKTRGTVLHVCGNAPKLRAHASNVFWKGKSFDGCGIITNRWLFGVNAVTATYSLGTSLVDGQPCMVMQYTDRSKVFRNVRDEVREISPGVWLGRCTDGPTGTLKNYFLLQAK